jgi:MerR family transcriptional regulator/heat shock protein HspR
VTTNESSERSRTRAVYVISVAAELAGMHPQTLRIYERRGLVAPARTGGGNRRYSDEDIAILKRISELTEQGMNLEGIRRVMHLEIENARLRAELDQAREIAKHAIAAAEGRRGGGDLVPLRQAVAIFGQRPSVFDDD